MDLFSGLLGAILGVLLSGLVAGLQEKRRRYDRQTELLVALHAEIVASITKVKEQNTEGEQIYASGNPSPFAVADDTDFVFESMKSDPAVLPKDVIYPIIRYYKLAGQSNGQVRGLSMDAFRFDQGPAEKSKYVAQLMELMQEQEKSGITALEALEKAASARGEDGLTAHRIRAGIGSSTPMA